MTGKKRPILDEFKLTELNQDDSEDLIQLVAMDDEHEHEQDAPPDVPILPIKNTVLFPGVVIPITVGRQKSIKLVKKAYFTQPTGIPEVRISIPFIDISRV